MYDGLVLLVDDQPLAAEDSAAALKHYVPGEQIIYADNAADAMILGRFVGKEALSAAGGSTGTVINLLVGFFVGLSSGATVIISQYYGAKRKEMVGYAVHTAMAFSLAAGLLLMIGGFAAAPSILKAMDTPTEVLDLAILYIRIYFLGVIGNLIYNVGAGILRAVGDSKRPLYFLIASCFVNIVLDVVFVAGFHMEVAGVALATVIAQLISAVLCILKLRRMTEFFDMKAEYLKPDGRNLGTVIRLGLPSGLTQAIFSLAMVVVQSLTNSFGEMIIAANVIIMRVDGFAMMPNFSFGTAMTTYAGQNVGARQYDRVKQGARQGTLIAVCTSAAITGLILLFGPHLMGVFTNTEELAQLSADMMKILAVGYIAMAVTQSLSGVMRGAGDTVTPMWISLLTTVAVRVPLAYGLVWLTRTPELPQGRYECIWISLLISWVLGAVATFLFYRVGSWKKKAL